MSVRAKMQVQSVTHFTYPEGARQVVLTPVYEENGVNKQWSQATPSGECRMMITNPEAAKQFETHQYYFVDFTLTTKEG